MLDPDHVVVFPFLENVKVISWMDEILQKHQFIGYMIGLVYVVVIFSVEYVMRNRAKYRLKRFSIFWNLFLLILNSLIVIRVLPHVVYLLNTSDFHQTLCHNEVFQTDPVSGFWLRLFAFVKVIELGDTLLIVLQKRKLESYYWIHHLGVLLVSWYLCQFYASVCVWMVLVVSIVHVFVYLYGIIRSCKISVPTYVPILLIAVEFLQVFGFAILNAFVYYYLAIGKYCDISFFRNSVLFSFVAICVVLCLVLFCRRYFGSVTTTKSNKSVETIVTIT